MAVVFTDRGDPGSRPVTNGLLSYVCVYRASLRCARSISVSVALDTARCITADVTVHFIRWSQSALMPRNAACMRPPPPTCSVAMRVCASRVALRAAALTALALQIASFVLLCALYQRPDQADFDHESVQLLKEWNDSEQIHIQEDELSGSAIVNPDANWQFAAAAGDLHYVGRRQLADESDEAPSTGPSGGGDASSYGDACGALVQVVTSSDVDDQLLPIVRLVAASWDACGRPPNALVLLRGGARLCARHRHAHGHYVVGEIVAWSLAKLLNLSQHLPCSALLVQSTSANATKRRSGGYEPLIDRLMRAGGAALGWKPSPARHRLSANNADIVVSLTAWIDGLQRVSVPEILLHALQHNGTIDEPESNEEPMLVQWSDMILFDYISGHYDRLMSLLDEWDKSGSAPAGAQYARNVALDADGTTLVWYDNEAAVLDAYATMYEPNVMKRRDDLRFRAFHRRCLLATCAYSERAAAGLAALAASSEPAAVLLRAVADDQPHFARLGVEQLRVYAYFEMHFASRLRDAMDHVLGCRRRRLAVH